MITLRDYQSTAVENLRGEYRKGNKRPLLVLPTGGGKTIIFTYITHASASNGNRVLILVHRAELLEQTSAALSKFGVKHGLITPAYTPDYNQRVQVASIQTLVRRLAHVHAPDLIVLDEAHHANAGTWKKVLDQFPNAKVLGVTATPVRADGQGLGDVFDAMVEGSTVRALIDAGYLVEPIIYAPSVPDLEGVKRRMGDYATDELAARMDKPSITGDAVAHYRKYADGLPAVAFCVSIKHAQHVAEQFKAAGYRAFCVDGSLDATERKRVLDGLGNGSVDVVTSCDIISEGTDIPAIGCAILLRPTQSLGLYIQQVGRALRPSAGKQYAIILDHAGNVLKHGLPDDERVWSLEEQEKKKRAKKGEGKEVSVRQCVECYACFKPTTNVCPQCGHVHAAKPRKLNEVDGELVEISAVLMQKKEARKQQGRARTYEELLQLEKERGYQTGWAAHIWASRQKYAK